MILREVVEADLPVFYEHQRDPETAAHAAFPSRDRDTYIRRLLDRREFWSRGLATQALTELLGIVDARPLHAYVAQGNGASIRVLEKCGFVEVGAHAADDGIEELLLELPA